MTSYILIALDDGTPCYQQVVDGVVVMFLNADGTPIGPALPHGVGSRVVDANPPRQAWMT